MVQIAHYMPEAFTPVKQHGGRLAQRVPVACRDYQPYPVDLPLSYQKRKTLTFKKKVDWRMRRAPEPQKKKWRDHNSRLNALVEDFDIDTEPLDYLFCLGELLSSV